MSRDDSTERMVARQRKRLTLREAEVALERELERQEILGRDIPRLVEVVIERVFPGALL